MRKKLRLAPPKFTDRNSFVILETLVPGVSGDQVDAIGVWVYHIYQVRERRICR